MLYDRIYTVLNPFSLKSRAGESNLYQREADQGLGVEVESDGKGARGNFLGWWKRSLSWVGLWLHGCVHFVKAQQTIHLKWMQREGESRSPSLVQIELSEAEGKWGFDHSSASLYHSDHLWCSPGRRGCRTSRWKCKRLVCSSSGRMSQREVVFMTFSVWESWRSTLETVQSKVDMAA